MFLKYLFLIIYFLIPIILLHIQKNINKRQYMEFNIKIIYNDGTIRYDRSFYFSMNTDYFEFHSCEDSNYHSIILDDIIEIKIYYHMYDNDLTVYQFYN